MVGELPKGNDNVPIGKQMNPGQAKRFTQISSQMKIHNLNSLAESRLARDNPIIGITADAIEKLQNGQEGLKSKYDIKSDGAAVVALLRKALENQNGTLPDPSVQTVCSLDLALFLEQMGATMARRKLLESPEAKEAKALREKYNPQGPLDPDKIPSPDKEKAVWLLKAVAEPASRLYNASVDWENVRRFARISQLAYTSLRADIITGAGASDFDYNGSLGKVYASGDDATKNTINAWYVIERSVPPPILKRQKEIAQIAEPLFQKTK